MACRSRCTSAGTSTSGARCSARCAILRSITPTLGDAIETLERATRTYRVALGIVRADRQRFYATQSPAHAHLGTTLVARMLGAVSPMVLATTT